MSRWTPTEGEIELVQRSRTAFEKYAAFGDALDSKEAQNFSEIQKTQIALIRWEIDQFGIQPHPCSVLGMLEEVGELLEALADGEGDPLDAIADVMVYLCNYCTKLRLDFETLADFRDAEEAFLDPMQSWFDTFMVLGRIAHVTLKKDQGIRGYDDQVKARLDLGVAFRRLLARVLVMTPDDDDVTELFINTAKKVVKRNWKKNPVSAGIHV